MDPQSPPVQTTPPQIQIPQEPIYQAENTRSKPLIMLMILVLIIVIIGGIYWFTNQTKKSPSTVQTTILPSHADTQPIITQPSIQASPTIAQVAGTEGWKKITNKNGFSFMYPESVDVLAGAAIEEKPELSTIITIREKGSTFDGPQMRIGLWDSINEKSESLSYPSSFSEFANVWYKTNVENPNVPVTIIADLHEISFQGKPGYEFTFNCKGFEAAPIGSIGPTGICRIVFVNNNGIFYSIGFYKNTVFDKIFETLKFE